MAIIAAGFSIGLGAMLLIVALWQDQRTTAIVGIVLLVIGWLAFLYLARDLR